MDLRILVFVVVLSMALIEFGKVWYFGADDRQLITHRPFGREFRMLLWLGILGCLGLHIIRWGLSPIIAVLAPMLPFLFWGAIVTVLWSISTITSIRTLVFWAFAAGIATVAGLEMSPKLLARSVAGLFISVVVGSFLLLVVDPSAAMAEWYGEPVVRGLFSQKNSFGWFSALGIVWIVGVWPLMPRLISVFGIAVLVAGLLASGSAAALGVGCLALGYFIWVRVTPTILGSGTSALVITLLAIFATTVFTLFALPLILELLGRDPTFSGRAYVWQHYLKYINNEPLTGFGPGLFTGTSDLAIRIGDTIPGFEGQGLFSTHSVYVALLGEAGFGGVALFVCGLGYVVMIAPFRNPGIWNGLAAAFGVAILVVGIAETRDGYGAGIATIMMLVARAQAHRRMLG